jgi:NADPH:quinone reductase-like Zn-dependent oxidoreductase
MLEDSEVLVRVLTSSVNGVDGAIAVGMLNGMVDYEFPVVLGRDFAGVVEQVGSRVTRYAECDELYGFLPHANPTVHDGSWAELIVFPEATSSRASRRVWSQRRPTPPRWPASLPCPPWTRWTSRKATRSSW